MFVAFTTLERDHNGGPACETRSKSRRLCGWLLRRVVVWSERASRIQAVSPDLYGLRICKDPNRTKTFASVLVFPQMFWASLDSANDSDDCEHVVKWSILRYRVNPIRFRWKADAQCSKMQEGRQALQDLEVSAATRDDSLHRVLERDPILTLKKVWINLSRSH